MEEEKVVRERIASSMNLKELVVAMEKKIDEMKISPLPRSVEIERLQKELDRLKEKLTSQKTRYADLDM